ncbi:T3SS effector HopA1 family protein [Actinomadura rubrisoli]|uniref:T3SS effector HopA1 family protein n=1 Tax=Actinomadura rubrisoli TaxID=2530368 RepID=UPI0014053747|nr:T3SS effector HopA1 family protein [Actinomadura rubrisoli]
MSDTRALVAEAIAATRIYPPACYSWFGVKSARPAARAARTLSSRATRDYLVDQLSSRLYADFYRHGRAERTRWHVTRLSASRHDFEAALSAANCGQGHLDGGWQVRGTDEYGVMVVKNGLELTVMADELTWTTPADVPAAGEWAALRLPKELFWVSPGFYLACGDRPMDSRRPVRLYWNLRPDGAAPFVAAATRLLNSAAAAFNLKVPNDPNAFLRCDAGVIYLPRDDYPALADLMLALHAEIAGFLSPRTPVFTAQLAPGLGFAEDPGTGRSFGEHRCRLLAEALVRSHESGWADDATVLAAVEERFAEARIDLDAAHLSPDLVGVS